MNARDIELPPLPNLIPVDHLGKQQAMQDYARAAIEADRQRRGEPVAWLTPGMELHSENPEGFTDWKPLYEAPQPAEPSDPVKDMVEEDNRLAAEQACNVLALRLGYVWNGVDWVLHDAAEPVIDCPESDKWNCKYCLRVKDCPVQHLRDEQPAEPVKVPSDAEVASLALRHEAHGEKWPDAEYRFREVDLVSFARALLARYGHMSTNPENLCTSAERAQESAESIHEPTLEEEEAWQQMERRNF